MIAIEMVYNK